jgi:uncharacterized membrane protein (UPF0136 family)
MNTNSVATCLYGASLIVGGTIGYVKKGSFPSLIAGTIAGSGSIIAATNFETYPRLWYPVAIVISNVICGIMCYRLWKTKARSQSSLILLILSAFISIWNTSSYLKLRTKTK